jgi:hypothetical protein
MDLVIGFDTGRGDMVTTSDGLATEPREGGRIPRVKEGLLDDAVTAVLDLAKALDRLGYGAAVERC